jgi:hypothetical protein
MNSPFFVVIVPQIGQIYASEFTMICPHLGHNLTI